MEVPLVFAAQPGIGLDHDRFLVFGALIDRLVADPAKAQTCSGGGSASPMMSRSAWRPRSLTLG
jgi:hypothetical protein